MFTLKLFDRIGNELKEGDIVKISNGRVFTFYAEVKYIESEGIIAPFHTFCFHSFEKVDKIPEQAKKSTEDRYDIWYVYDENEEQDEKAPDFEKYLMSWRECEHKLEKRSWAIEKIDKADYFEKYQFECKIKNELLELLKKFHKHALYKISEDDDRPTHLPYELFDEAEYIINQLK